MPQNPPQSKEGPLVGVRVIDLSRVIAGPWCAQILADYGADVIKIEHPERGDDSRAWAPPMVRDKNGKELTESVSFSACNRGKRSVAIDIANPEQLAILQDLIGHADVLVENFKFGGLKKYGLDYKSLTQLHPKLIYCSFTGYGQSGPYRERPGYDTIMQGQCGYMSLTGHPDHLPGGGPLKMGLPIIDIASGVYGATAILAALRAVEAGGKGQHIDISLMDVGVAALGHMALGYLSGNPVPVRRGNRLPMVYPSDAFQCRDGWVMIIAGNDGQFARLCRALNIETILDDPRFKGNPNRIANVEPLHEALSTALADMNVSDCIARCSGVSVPCGPINDIEQVFADEHVRARGLAGKVQHPAYGDVPTVSNPVKFSASLATSHHAPPQLGEHTEEVIERLKTSGKWPARAAS